MNPNLKQRDIPRFQELDTVRGKRTVPIEVRRSKRARYIRLSVSPRRVVVVTVPWRAKEEDALNFLASKSDWVLKKLELLKQQPNLLDFLLAKKSLTIGSRLMPLVIHVDPELDKLCYRIGEDRVEVWLINACDKELKLVIRNMAKKVLAERVAELCDKNNLEVMRVTVRDQLTVWGSCSSKKSISLNWRLLLIEPALQDYIIYHELAHLTHMNHSRKFWKLVQDYDHNSLENDQRISEISSLMMSIGR